MAELKDYEYDMVRIVPVDAKTNSQALSGMYPYKGKYRIANTPFSYVEKDPPQFIKNNPNPNPPCYDIVFNNNKKVHEIEVSTDKNAPSELRDNYKMVMEFYHNHPDCLINGKEHARSRTDGAAYNIIWESTEQRNIKNDYDQTLNAMQIITSMSHEDKINILYWFNSPARGLKPVEVTQRLLGKPIGTGILFKHTDGVSNIELLERIVEHKMTNYDKYVTIQKAIAYNIIERKQVGKGFQYIYNGDICGLNPQDVMQYFTNNIDLYGVLLDKTNDVDKDEMAAGKVEAKDLSGEVTEGMIKQRLKALKEKGLWKGIIPGRIDPKSPAGQDYLAKIEKLEEQEIEAMAAK